MRVAHEAEFDKRRVKASIILKNNFGEILDHIQFSDWHGREGIGIIGGDAEKRKAVIDIWKQAVDVQMHFNDIEMKIRGLFVTIVLGLAAAQGFLLHHALSFSVGPVKVLYATFMPLLGIMAACLFYFMDRYWYHRLLIGAVKQGASIETRYAKELPELALTARIGEASPVDTNKWTGIPGWIGKKAADWLVKDDKYWKNNSKSLHSDGKIELFYKSVGYLCFVAFLASVLFAGVLIREKTLATRGASLICQGVRALIETVTRPPAAPITTAPSGSSPTKTAPPKTN